MAQVLMKGSTGNAVQQLKQALQRELGADAGAYPGLAAGNAFDSECEAALRQWQAGIGAIADGIAGPHCLQLLGLAPPRALQIRPQLDALRLLFPQTKPSNIVRFLPYVTDALEAFGLVDRPMILAAFGTIRAETAGFVPIPEYASRFNTLAGKPPFSAYDPGTSIGQRLGNTQPGDGARFCGRGFVQLTGRSNYTRYSQQLLQGTELVDAPQLANAPEIAAALLALFLANCAAPMRAALQDNDFAAARRLVNGGSHGLQEFQQVFAVAEQAWPDDTTLVGARRDRTRATAVAQAPVLVRQRDTRRDPPDLRDRQFQPAPVLLPDVWPPESDVRARFDEYRVLVMDQGTDASCTGYGLACVINFARWQKSGYAPELKKVSARMLYNFARRYDEYEGEDYDGSSCRGALKGWYNNGVCLESDWPDHDRPRYGYA
jgi:predicted chitinase